MQRFLSEENITLHRDYVRVKRLKYSIIESSVSALKDADIGEIFRMKIDSRDKRDAITLLSEIKLHEIFFSSFSDSPYPRSESVANGYGNEANFLNLLYKEAMALPYGFILVYQLGQRIEVKRTYAFPSALRYTYPSLAIDVCEHAYFMDYGFDKERYLVSLLPYLNIALLSVTDK